jgi:hypothetical protein
MKSLEVVVTRHPALVEYLRELGWVTDGVRIIEHAVLEDVAGKRTAGVLPLWLAAETEWHMEVPLELPAEMRGKELTLADVRQYSRGLMFYRVTRFCNHWTSFEMREAGLLAGG